GNTRGRNGRHEPARRRLSGLPLLETEIARTRKRVRPPRELSARLRGDGRFFRVLARQACVNGVRLLTLPEFLQALRHAEERLCHGGPRLRGLGLRSLTQDGLVLRDGALQVALDHLTVDRRFELLLDGGVLRPRSENAASEHR